MCIYICNLSLSVYLYINMAGGRRAGRRLLKGRRKRMASEGLERQVGEAGLISPVHTKQNKYIYIYM